MKKFCLLLIALLLAFPAVAQDEMGVRIENLSPSMEYKFRFDSSDSVNDFSAAIPACPTMVITFEQATAGEATVYATNKTDTTFTSITSGTSLATLGSTTTTQVEVSPASSEVRVVITAAETSGTSEVRIVCSNLAGIGGSVSSTGNEETLAYLFQLNELPNDSLAYEGGTKDFYFSQNAANLLPLGNDSTGNGSRAAPFLSCNKMEEIVAAVEGARIWVDGADGSWAQSGNCAGMLNFVPFCDGTRGLCATVSAMDPAEPFTIDATGAVVDAAVCNSSVSGASMAFQNMTLENVTNTDGFDSDGTCLMLIVNGQATVSGNASDQPFTSHDTSHMIVIGPRTRGTITSTSGANQAVTSVNASDLTLITTGLFENLTTTGSTNQKAVSLADGWTGNALIIGPEFRTDYNNGGVQAFAVTASPGDTKYVDGARFFINAQGVGFRTTITGADEDLFLNLWQTTIRASGDCIQLVNAGQSVESSTIASIRDSLLDDCGVQVIDADADPAGTLDFTFQGVIDEDDAVTPFDLYGTTYTTLALFQAAYAATNDTWDVATDDTYADLGGTGIQCGHEEASCGSSLGAMPTGTCHVNRACSDSQGGTYVLPVRAASGIPYVIPGVTLTSFRLNRGQIGAR